MIVKWFFLAVVVYAFIKPISIFVQKSIASFERGLKLGILLRDCMQKYIGMDLCLLIRIGWWWLSQFRFFDLKKFYRAESIRSIHILLGSLIADLLLELFERFDSKTTPLHKRIYLYRIHAQFCGNILHFRTTFSRRREHRRSKFKLSRFDDVFNL